MIKIDTNSEPKIKEMGVCHLEMTDIFKKASN